MGRDFTGYLNVKAGGKDQRKSNRFGTHLHFTGHSPAFYFPFKCRAEHLNERGRTLKRVR